MKLLRLLWRGFVAAVLILFRRGPRRGKPPSPPSDPSERETAVDRRAESLVLALLALVSGCAFAFMLLYVLHDDTQLLGVALGVAFAALAAASIVASKRVVPQETAVEERPRLEHREDEKTFEQLVREGGEGISRRRLLMGAAGVAGASLGAAALLPATSLGPSVSGRIEETPWRRGRRVVGEDGEPIDPDELALGSFVTGFPEGADPRELGSPIVIVRVPPGELELPPERAGWAPEGIVAYSKICTHAGCAIALYRKPHYAPTAPRPALVCPCHYSTFDVRRGAEVIFGPAGRPLPQLPLAIDEERKLVASGGFSAPVGPSWWSVRR
jgi:ubiquinol-cytochrome c reductase iron-sulfur subunit